MAPKCNGAALALSSPSMPGLWCQSTTERLWHHKPGVLGLESASAAPLHFGATPGPPHVYPTSTSRDVSDQAFHAHNCPHAHNSPAYNERLAGNETLEQEAVRVLMVETETATLWHIINTHCSTRASWRC